jgi:integrase
MLAGRLQRRTTTLATRMEDAVRVRLHLPSAPGSGAALCQGLRASSRRSHRPTGQPKRQERTQNWIKLGATSLPKRPKRVIRHHPALPYAEAAQFLVELGKAEGRAAVALRFLIFTVCRTNEIVGAKWTEIERTFPTGPVWKIPGDRMKMDQDHFVPLSQPALGLLDELSKGQQSDLIFTNPDGQEFSENAMLAVLDRIGYGHFTVHGFRATFATWAEECTDYPDGVREAALAHKYKSETTAAYQRGAKLEKRRALMDDWAGFISTPSNVVNVVQLARG